MFFFYQNDRFARFEFYTTRVMSCTIQTPECSVGLVICLCLVVICNTTPLFGRAGFARERVQRKVDGQLDSSRAESVVGHVRRAAAGQIVRDNVKPRSAGGKIQGVSNDGQGAGGIRSRGPGHAEPSDPREMFPAVVK